jgi:hypothetical protein
MVDRVSRLIVRRESMAGVNFARRDGIDRRRRRAMARFDAFDVP